LQIIINYDYACFRCPIQQKDRNCLRIGISPDATLAYIDVLYDEGRYNIKTKPLCPIGQVKLPVSFKLAGLGTYCSPYYIDTNDLILQAVPQTDVPSSFINEAWILFIVELNIILRSVQADALNIGILQLMKFVNSKKNTAHLGGLHINICTFSNIYIYDNNNNSNNSRISQQSSRNSKSDDNQNELPEKLKLKHEIFTTNRESFSSGNIFTDFIDFINDKFIKKKDNNNDNIKSNVTTIIDHDHVVENILHHGHNYNDNDNDNHKNHNNRSISSSSSRSLHNDRSSNSNIQVTDNTEMSFLNRISSLLSSFFYSKFDYNDLCGKNLSFDEMCSATRQGQLCLGEIY